jgi:hypothetical protein
MLKIDNNLLVELGLAGLPDAEKNSFLKHIYETLEMRVGIRLADQMSNEQLDEFEQYFEAKDDAGAFKWLETNFPNYKDIVQEEFDKLKREVAVSAPQILAASQQAAAQAVAQPGMPPAAAAAPLPQSAPAPAYGQPQQPLNSPAPMPPAPTADPYAATQPFPAPQPNPAAFGPAPMQPQPQQPQAMPYDQNGQQAYQPMPPATPAPPQQVPPTDPLVPAPQAMPYDGTQPQAPNTQPPADPGF